MNLEQLLQSESFLAVLAPGLGFMSPAMRDALFLRRRKAPAAVRAEFAEEEMVQDFVILSLGEKIKLFGARPAGEFVGAFGKSVLCKSFCDEGCDVEGAFVSAEMEVGLHHRWIVRFD